MRTFLTNAICPKCGNFLKTSDIEGYGFVCDDCDENFYSIETNVPFDDYFEISVKMTADKYKKHEEKLRELVEKYDCDFLGFDEFFSQLQQENPRFIKVFEEYLDDLTTGINNLYIMCDGNVVVGGPVAKYLVPYQDKIRRMLVEKYSFDTDGSYFSFAQCTAEQADTGAALMFLGEFISNI